MIGGPQLFYRLGVETTQLPSLFSYLERLPRGLDSYPDVVVKASVYLTVRRGMCGAFRAASVAAGARDVTAEIVDAAERETRVRVCWR